MVIDVYADVLFAINFLMDLVIIFVTAVMAREKICIARISIAAAVLASYGTFVFYPQISFIYSVLGRALMSAAAVIILCKSLNIKRLLKAALVFWISTAVAGGAVYGMCMMTSFGRIVKAVTVNGSLYMDVGLDSILMGTVAAYAMIYAFKLICIRNFSRDKILFPAEVYINDKIYEVSVLADTGCELKLPVTGEGVLLIPEKRLKGLNADIITEIPVSTVGGGGKIPVFYPDKIECYGRYRINGSAAVGIVKEEFTEDGLYTAVINPEAIEEVKENETNRSDSNAEKVKNIYSAAGAKAVAAKEKGSILHRRQRNAAGAAEPQRGGGTVKTFGRSGAKRAGAENFDRTESETGCIYSEKV